MIIKWVPAKILYNLTDKLTEINRAKDAIRIMEKRVALEEANPFLKSHLAHLYNRDDRRSEAIKIIQELVSLYPDSKKNSLLRWRLARAFLSLGKYAEAIPLLIDSVKYWIDNSSPNAFLGMAYLSLNKHELAEGAFNASLKINERNVDARTGMVDVYLETGRRNIIRRFLDDYLACAPNDVISHALMADDIIRSEMDYYSAYSHYSHALNLYEKQKGQVAYNDFISTWQYPDALVDKCIRSLVHSGMDNEAMQLNRQYYGKNKQWDPYLVRKTGNLKKAFEIAEKNLQKKSNSYDFHQDLGLLYLLANQYKNAEKELLETLQIAKKMSRVSIQDYVPLVVLYTSTQNNEKAEELKKESLKLSKEETWGTLAISYLERKEWANSLNAAKKALELLPDDTYTLSILAEAQAGLGMNEEALKQCLKISQKQPQNGKIWLIKAKIYSSLGEDENALSAISYALDSHNLSSLLKTEANKLKNSLKKE